MNLVTRFTGLYQSETLVDVTLAAEGKHLQVSCAAIICPIDDFYHASLFPPRNIKILTNMQKKIFEILVLTALIVGLIWTTLELTTKFALLSLTMLY